MASGNKGPVMRLKAKRKDGTELTAKDRDGNAMKLPRVELGVVWDNEGRMTFKFTDERVGTAVNKALGGDCYFDLYRNDPPKARAEAAEDDDSDF